MATFWLAKHSPVRSNRSTHRERRSSAKHMDGDGHNPIWAGRAAKQWPRAVTARPARPRRSVDKLCLAPCVAVSRKSVGPS
eukprot:9363409-Pyramimonas_sp.AAC.1